MTPMIPRSAAAAAAAPVGMTIACNHLYFYGLNTKRENVVFAVNRGQTQGAAGNFTMFNIQGTGLKSENVTFGNYCNVDLKFPLDPSLSRAKRADAIAQAQLFSYNGGDGVAINSRLRQSPEPAALCQDLPQLSYRKQRPRWRSTAFTSAARWSSTGPTSQGAGSSSTAIST